MQGLPRTFSQVGPELEIEADRAAKLESALETLDDREREILESRHLTEDPLQLKELGEKMGVSKQRVAQLEQRALKKLRAQLSDLESAA